MSLKDDFYKLAVEKKLISEDEKKEEKTNLSKYDPSDIELIYGFKLDPGILERAHPETSILFPAHDKFNGVVENLIERQNRMVEIVDRNPRPTQTARVYVAAEKELQNELISLGMLLDQKDETELMVLADNCSEKMIKQALAPLAIAGIVIGVVALYTVLTQNFKFSQGVTQDCKKTLVEIQEAIDDYPQLQNDLNPLIEKITALNAAGDSISGLEYIFTAPKDKNQVAQKALQNIKQNYDEAAIKKLEGYKQGCLELAKIIPDYIDLLRVKKSQYAGDHYDFFMPIVKLYRAIIPSDIDDVISSLNSLLKSVSELPSLIASQIAIFRKMRSKIDNSEEFQAALKGEEIKKPEEQPKLDIKKPEEQQVPKTAPETNKLKLDMT